MIHIPDAHIRAYIDQPGREQIRMRGQLVVCYHCASWSPRLFTAIVSEKALRVCPACYFWYAGRDFKETA